MATSQNGWSVFFGAPAGLLRWVTGRVRPDPVKTVFDYLCKRLNEVEKNKQSWSWGWAVRAIRGQTSGYSNHASATAIDYNAPAHPLGVRGTWSAEEIRRIDKILDDMDGVIRWGEHYSGRVDGMHFEIDKGFEAVQALATKIINKRMPDQKPDWTPRMARAINFGRVQEQFLIAARVEDGEIKRLNGVGVLQKALNRALPGANLHVDGYVGKSTLDAWGRWEEKAGGSGRLRIPDRTSVEALCEEVDIEVNDNTWDD